MHRNKKLKILLLVFLGVFVIFLALILKEYLEERSTNTVGNSLVNKDSQMDQLEMFVGERKQFNFILDGEDLTKEAYWYSVDPPVINLVNISEKKGYFRAMDEGETVVRGMVDDKWVEKSVVVSYKKSDQRCAPNKKVAKVGEEVTWLTDIKGDEIYFKGGSLEWISDDGLQQRESLLSKVYETIGEKSMRLVYTQSDGIITKIECDALKVE